MTPTLDRIISTIRVPRVGVLDVYFGAGERQAAVEQQFFSSLWMPNGTAKTSHDGRLDDLNALVSTLLPADTRVAVMDVAAGSGISSLEWAEQLTATGREVRMLIGDLHAWGWLSTWGTRCAVLYLDDGRPLTVEFYGRRLDLASGRLIVRGARFLTAALFGVCSRAQPAATLAAPRKWRPVHRRIPLFSPRVLGSPAFALTADDIGVPGRFREQFDVVRAANILNRSYFDETTLSRFAANLVARVRDGGLLAICRTSCDGTNRGTVFRRTGRSVVVRERLGGGSEVEDLVLASGAAAWE
ncbi:MAG: hypothetical protein ACJ76X_07070 [Solirubrobacteraceae bacterium]